MQLETPRLIIRDFALTDAAFILQLVNEPAFHINIGDKGVRTLDDARAYIQNAGLDSYEKLGFGMYLVVLKDAGTLAGRSSEPIGSTLSPHTNQGTPIGMCGLLKRDFLQHPDVGFAYASAYWNKGYGTEAAKAVMHWATTVLGYSTLSAFTTTTNGASIQLLKKSGFTSLGEQIFPGRDAKSHVLIWNASSEPYSGI